MGGIIDSDNVDIGDFFEKVGLVRLAKQRQCTSSKVLSRIQLRLAICICVKGVRRHEKSNLYAVLFCLLWHHYLRNVFIDLYSRYCFT